MPQKLLRGAVSLILLIIIVWLAEPLIFWLFDFFNPTLKDSILKAFVVILFLFVGFGAWVIYQSYQMAFFRKNHDLDNFYEQARLFSRVFGFDPNIKKQNNLSSAELDHLDCLVHKTLKDYARLVDLEFQLSTAVEKYPGFSIAYDKSISDRLADFDEAKNLAEWHGYTVKPDWKSYGPFKKIGV